jgi:hypothetical protein
MSERASDVEGKEDGTCCNINLVCNDISARAYDCTTKQMELQWW